MDNVTNISLVGVGGQGILLTSEILARAAMFSGFDVKKSEVHGMSQRGGSVTSQVRFGKKVYSPIISEGESHILVAFEKLEAIRNFKMLRHGGTVLVDNRSIIPITVSGGLQAGLGEQEEELLKQVYGNAVKFVDSTRIATQLGNMRVANMVIAGVLSKLLPFDVEMWYKAMKSRIPEKIVDINIRAFDCGRA